MTTAERPPTAGDIVLGVDIGGTKTALLAWDRATETVLAQDAFETPADAPATPALVV